MFRSQRVLSGLVAVLVTLFSLSACSGSDESGTTSTEVVDSVTITMSGDTVEPNGKRIEVARNKPFTFVIDSDVAGEIHIHSKPEQTITYAAGKSQHEVTFETPGVFPAEVHDLEKVVVELEVR